MRIFLVVISVLLIPMFASGQSVWLDDGQSGVFLEGGYGWTENTDTYGVDVGYASDGRSDFGLSFSKTNITWTNYYFRDGYFEPFGESFNVSTLAQFFQTHLVKKPLKNHGAAMLTFSELLSFQGESLFPDGDSFKTLVLGGYGTLRFGPDPKAAFLLSAGYNRAIYLEEGAGGSNIASFRIGLSFYQPTTVFGINFGFDRSEGITSYAVSINLGQVKQITGRGTDF